MNINQDLKKGMNAQLPTKEGIWFPISEHEVRTCFFDNDDFTHASGTKSDLFQVRSYPNAVAAAKRRFPAGISDRELSDTLRLRIFGRECFSRLRLNREPWTPEEKFERYKNLDWVYDHPRQEHESEENGGGDE